MAPLLARYEAGKKPLMPWPDAHEASSDDVIVADRKDPARPRLSRQAAVELMLATYNEDVPAMLERKWQVHVYPEPVLFTYDQPVTPWGPELARGKPVSLKNAYEIRIPLDPHARCCLALGTARRRPPFICLM